MTGNDQSWQKPFLGITDIGKRHSEIRKALRVMLKGRTRMVRGASLLPCGCCGRDVKSDFQMHEALIARSSAVMAQHHLIFVPQNVIQICPKCHGEHQGTQHLMNKALPYLIKVEGAESVAAWWLDVAPRLTLSVGTAPEDGDWEAYLLDAFGVTG